LVSFVLKWVVPFVARRQFGVSTHLYHGQRLSRDHLLEIAAHGFETIEVCATRSHFDYHNPAAVADLQQWMAEAGLTLHGIHAPVMHAYEGSRWIGPLSLASSDADARAEAVAETEQALHIARRIPVKVLATHLGLPRTVTQGAAPRQSSGQAVRQSSGQAPDGRAAARRSIEEVQRVAEPLGVQIAVEVIPNELSRAGSLVHFVEEDVEGLDGRPVGICLDFGHAHLDGDLVDAIETVSEHFITVHVHDNRGRADDHLVPFEGTIDWPAALTAIQKVGYEGPLMFEMAARGSAKETLVRAQKARHRMERLLAD
jgi:sugar phosphate isomerase/epimerase